MSESTRDLWVGTMHRCDEVNYTMESVTRRHHQFSEQYVEMSTTRRQRGNFDIKLLIELLQQFDPFLYGSRLRCIITGVAVDEDDAINCNEVETIGAEIQQSLDGFAVSKTIVPRSKHIKDLARMSSGSKVRDDTIQINETVLFQRLIVLMECTDDFSAFLESELTPTPRSLCKDGYLRKASKSV